MSAYFLDSSALAKRYLAEVGSGWVQTLTAVSSGNRIVIAQITPIELVSVLARKQREAAIAPRTMQAAMHYLTRHIRREYILIRLQPSVEETAKQLLITYTLRAYDAVQLASALEFNQRIVTAGFAPVVFVCADNRLLAVARQEGIGMDNPNNHP